MEVDGGAAELCTDEPQLARKLAKSIGCLAAVGEYVMIEVSPQRVSLRSINQAKTAFCVLNVDQRTFQSYTTAQDQYHCRVNAKDMQHAFKNLKNLERLRLLFDNDASAVRVTLDLKSGEFRL